MDEQVIARHLAAELVRMGKENSENAPGQGLSPWGGTKFLLSEGLPALPLAGSQRQMVLQRTSQEPRPWIVTMSGLTSIGPVAGAGYPFAKFHVTWGSSAASYKTEVDGFSDQFLAVWGNQVTVECEWDFATFAEISAISGGLSFPQRMQLNASISPSDGAITKAWRSFATATAAGSHLFVINVPYGAIGVIVRQFNIAPVAVTLTWQTTQGGIPIDLYTPASVALSHDAGGYLSVPSMADQLNVLIAADVHHPSIVLVEFLVEP